MKFIILSLLTVSLSLSYGETVVSGIINQNTWWTKDKSPYVITNDLVISQNARLLIDPGVEILIEKPLAIPKDIVQLSSSDTFSVTIRVLGALQCKGKPDSPIIFRGRYISKGDEYTHWDGIILNSSRSNEISLSHTYIHNAVTGLSIRKGTPLIRNFLAERNNIGIKAESSSSPRIVNALFTDNFFSGIRIEKANPEIYNSIFYENRNIAIYSDRVSKITIQNCGFFKNSKSFAGCSPEFGVPKKINKNNDSTDIFGNLKLDPMFAGSLAEEIEIKKKLKDLHGSTIKSPDAKLVKAISSPTKYSESRKYYLSKHSPYIDAGHSAARFKEPDGSLPDLGIWGGPEFLQF